MPKPPRCPEAGLNRHRLEAQPVVVGLLEHLPGDVPYSTHLELENARSRLVRRALGEALDGLATHACGRSESDGAGTGPQAMPPTADSQRGLPGASRAVRPVLRGQTTVQRVQRVQRWPLGGLIDLVI